MMKIDFLLIGYSFFKFIGIIYFCINKILNICYKLIENLKNTLRYLRLKFFMCTLKKNTIHVTFFKKILCKIFNLLYN